MKTIQCWRLNIEIANESNSTEHWTKKHKRHKKQKMAIRKAFLADKPVMTLPVHVVLTRISPRQMDSHDNLPMSMKFCADAIADYLWPNQAPGRADDNPEITWEYKQEKGKPREYGFRIEMVKDETIS